MNLSRTGLARRLPCTSYVSTSILLDVCEEEAEKPAATKLARP
ncbi:hypothetical protein [Gimesia alba]|nr:hypothetical protein [Gimesia alba]